VSTATVQSGKAPTLPADVSRFLGALFAPADHILQRPIETWAEGGRKRSRVAWREVRYYTLGELTARPALWGQFLDTAGRERAS
jgi:hypothetical protein